MGVTILGGLVLLAATVVFLIGLAGVFVGLAGLIPGSPIPAGTLIAGGVLYLILGVILGVAGGGLLRLRIWAWWLAALATLVALAYGVWGILQAGAGASLGSLVAATVTAVVFVYVISVYRYFRRPAPSA